ncbi:MAG: carboxylesterase family protein [Gammaproteobacteria bacterium]|nr:carboxylesterase family protein [Gammaproteobacteria bacterium]
MRTARARGWCGLCWTALAAWPLVAGAATGDAPIVQSGHERFRGVFDPAAAGIARFTSIPYAAAPVGPLRWRAPRTLAPRAGVQDATHFAPACYQNDYNLDWYRQIWRAFGVAQDPMRNPPFSEDCLYLNVWTPRPAATANLPVLVWIHGGNNVAGWPYEPNYLGAHLAARGPLVFVSIAYRLGIFGFFSHPALADAPFGTNFGLLDQIAALRWVHGHIRAFGGDPQNVTIAGESAGGADVQYLMASPLARGLFRRAISESGGYMLSDTSRRADAERLGTELAAALPGDPDLAAMRRLPSARIFAAALHRFGDHTYLPVVDGRSLTESPAAYFAQHGAPVDLLIGSNADESYMYVDGSRRGLAHDLAGFPAAARAPLAHRAAAEATPRLRRARIDTLAEMTCPTYLLAGAAADHGHRAWVYRFSRRRPGPGGVALRVYHGSEIPYALDTPDPWMPATAADRRLTLTMSAYWAAFVRDGDPNGGSRPPWPLYRPAAPRILRLDTSPAAVAPPDFALCTQIGPSLYPGWTR